MKGLGVDQEIFHLEAEMIALAVLAAQHGRISWR
jgi:hypothetical protein